MEEKNNQVLDNQEDQVVAENEAATPKAKKPFPVTAVVIGAIAVAFVAVVIAIVVLLLGKGNGGNTPGGDVGGSENGGESEDMPDDGEEGSDNIGGSGGNSGGNSGSVDNPGSVENPDSGNGSNSGNSGTDSGNSGSGGGANSGNGDSDSTTTDPSHKHDFTIENATTQYMANSATCIAPATYYYSCSCGQKGTGTFSYGHPMYHTTNNGICTRCGTEYISPYQAAINAENDRYNGVLEHIEDQRDTLDYNEKNLTEEMRDEGIYTLYSSSYYENKIDALMDKINDKYSDISYYTMLGDYSTVSRLQNDISNLQDDVSYWNVHYMFAQRKEQIRYDRQELTNMERDASTYHSNQLSAINDQYSNWNSLYNSGHMNFDDSWTETLAPTCLEDGTKVYKCDFCDYHISGSVDKLGHDMLNPTCTDNSKCSRCDYNEGESLGHIWVDETCTTDQYCSRCSITGENLKLGHDYISYEGKAATCTEYGWYEYNTCSRCSYSSYQRINPLGHDESVKEHLSPSKVENGYNIYECSRCPYERTEKLYATGSTGLTYTRIENGYKVSIGSCGDSVLVIPAYHSGIAVTSIGSFAGGTMEEIHIPETVKSIQEDAFIKCADLKVIEVDSDNTVYSSAGNCLILNSGGVLIAGCQDSIIPSDGSVKEIGRYAFVGASKMTNIVIPDTVEFISSGSFSGCSSLKSMTIPFVGTSTVENVVYREAFGCIFGQSSYDNSVEVKQTRSMIYNGSYLSDIKMTYYLPASLREITVTGFVLYPYALENCTMLETISLGEGVRTFYDHSIDNCTGLKHFYTSNSEMYLSASYFSVYGTDLFVKYDNAYYLGSIDNPYLVLIKAVNQDISSCTIHPDTEAIGNNAFFNCVNLTSIIIPDKVKVLNSSVFNSCTSLSDITFGKSIQEIGSYCFWGTAIKDVVLPDSLRTLRGSAFYMCEKLESVIFGEGIEIIKNNTFYYCTSLKYVVLPTSLKTIEAGAFYNTSSLTAVYYYGDQQAWNSISVGCYNWQDQYINSATKYYYSEVAPTEWGNWWRMVNDKPEVWS